MGVKWDPKEHAWVPDDFVDWHKEPPLKWDPESQATDMTGVWGDTIEDMIKLEESRIGPDKYGPRLMKGFRFRDQQHEEDRQDQISLKKIAAKIKGLFKIAPDEEARLGSQDTLKHFRGITEEERAAGGFTRPVSFIDIETGDNDQVISVSVVKGVNDQRTGEFRVLDTLEKYYTPDNTYSQSFNMSREVHKLTPERIAALRNIQAASYSEKYDEQEAKDLLGFLHGSLIVGHNVEEFDFSRLGIASQLQNEDILDTMVWAENAGAPRGKRGLDPVFQHLTGKTLKQAGYTHHLGFHDVLSNAELYEAAYRNKGKAGRDLRFVANHKGYSYGAFEGAAGTAIIRGGYYKGRGPRGLENYMNEDEFDDGPIFDQPYDPEGNPIDWDYDEQGRRVLPEGFSEEEASSWYGPDDVGLTPSRMVNLISDEVFAGFTEKLEEMKEAMGGYMLAQNGALIRFLASKDEDTARTHLKGLGYKDEKIEEFITKSTPLRAARERKIAQAKELSERQQHEKVSEYLEHLYRKRDITEEEYNWLKEANETDSGYTPQEIVYRAREARDELKIERAQAEDQRQMREDAVFGNLKSFVRDLNEEPEIFNRKEAEQRLSSEQDITFENLKSFVRDLNEQESPFGSREDDTRKLNYLNNIQQKNLITDNQRASLELIGSYEDLVDATNDVIEANQRLAKVYQTLGSIKPYDINQLIGAAEGQWGGIKHASKGVIPGFIRTPLSRLGDAAFNSIERSITPWNAAGRIFGAVTPKGSIGGGTGVGGTGGLADAIGPGAKAKAGLGVFNAGTQVIGNIAQARVEMAGLSIQNNLNTLGAIISWVSTPFQLLHKALKLATGALGGFTFKLNNFMGGGINLMTQMGNPLTNLTGVNYNTYMGTTLMDKASLLGKGTTNKAIEGLASQQQMFYTLGQVDTNRLVASSLLGVYSDVYTPDQDPQEQYANIANKLVADMKANPASRSRIMSLAPLISNELAQMIQTADLLGVDDVRTLQNPRNRGMYWNPIDDERKDRNGLTEAARFRWTQYEYGASQEQFGVSKMRFADRLWRSGGKQIYSSLNELVDAAATGNWDAILKKATDMWTTFHDKFDQVWKGLQGAIAKDEDNELINSIKAVGLQIENVVIAGSLKILDVWNSVMASLAKKLEGAMAYLSTIKIVPHISPTGMSFSIESIDTAQVPERNKNIYSVDGTGAAGEITGLSVNKGMEGYALLADQLFPDYNDFQKSNLTPQDLYWALGRSAMNQETIDIPEYGLHGFQAHHSEEANELLDMLGKGENGDPVQRNFYRAAALRQAQLGGVTKDYSITGVSKFVKEFSDDTMDVVSTLLTNKYNENKARVEILFKDATGKRAMIEADSDGKVVSKNMNLLSQMVPNVADMAVNLFKG